MTFATSQLQLFMGVVSSKSLGNTGTTDDYPSVIDLYEGDFSIKDESGGTWVPQLSTLKNNGVRADSPIETGSSLVAAAMGNVIETISVYAQANTTIRGRVFVIKKLLAMAQAARDYHTTPWQSAPVYIMWKAAGAPDVQWSLIINMDISPVRYDPTNLNDVQEITITIEREPFWRALAPGDNPKKWAFYSRGLTPTSGSSPGATEYNFTHLDLLSTFAGAASYRSLYQQTIINGDEAATTSVNYIDIPASAIPGDAPCKALITFTAQGTVTSLYVARTTQRDLFSSNNNNATNQRARNTFNATEATLYAPGAPTVVKTAVATGWRNSTSGVREVVDVGFGVGGAATSLFYWQRVLNQYRNKYIIFLRMQITAGLLTSAAGMAIWAYLPGFSDFIEIISLTPIQTAYDVLWVGLADFTKLQRLVGTDGRGIDTATLFNLEVVAGAGAAITYRFWDLTLVPYDESIAFVQNAGSTLLSSGQTAFIDTTGYFNNGSTDQIALSTRSTYLIPREARGDGIELVPGVNNRIYIVADTSAPDPTVQHQVRVDLMPCWYGVRDS